MSFLKKLTSSILTKKQSYTYADQEKDMALVERSGRRVAQQQRAYEERLIIEEKLDTMFDNEFPQLSDKEKRHIVDIANSQSGVSELLTEDQRNMLMMGRVARSVARQQRAAQAQFIAEKQARSFDLNNKERSNIDQLFKDAYIKSKE